MRLYLKIFLLPMIIFTLGATVSYLNYINLKTEQINHAQNELALRKEKVVANIKEKLKLYEYGLRGFRGAVLNEHEVTYQNVLRYIKSRNIKEEFPGALGFGYVKYVPHNELAKNLKFLSREYKRPIKLVQFGLVNKEHYIVQFNEPYDINYRSIGVDLASEINRYEVARESMLSGEAVISHRITLVQDNKNLPGFIYLLPIYQLPLTVDTEAERIKKIKGWSFTPIILTQVFDDLMHSYNDEFSIEVYSDEIMNDDFLIYNSHPDKMLINPKSLSMEGQFRVGQKIWSYYIITLPKFNDEYLSNTPSNYFLVSLMIAILIAAIVLVLQLTLIRARAIADRMTLSYKEAVKVKSDFLATMSHEIRTPLNGVLGLTELFKETNLNEEQKHYMDSLASVGKTLKVIIDDILDFSKIEAEQMHFELRPFDLLKMCQEVVGLYQKLANDKKIKLNIVIKDDVPGIVVGDETRIRQIVSNIFNNAIKFTSKGTVELIVGLDKIQTNPDGKTICTIDFTILDTGIGMDNETLSKLFTKFTQADSSITRKYGGTGLGLAISKMLCEKMGGRILVNSKSGIGSSFKILIPVEKGSELINEVRYENADIDKNLRILVVEDNEINILVIKKMLNKFYQNVEIAQNGIEAIETVIHGEFDLIIMDCQMPYMDGLKATQEIRKIEKKHHFIIGLSANVTAEDRIACIQSGMDDFLTKPVNRSELYEKIQKAQEKMKLF